MSDLCVFDPIDNPKELQKISVEYRRITKIKPIEVSKEVTWAYVEYLIIDRETQTMEQIQVVGSGCKISHKYEVEDGMNNLLDAFDADTLFGNIVGNPSDVIETPNDRKDYKITIDYKNTPQKIITGTFDKHGLPDDFEEFAHAACHFMRFYGQGEMLNPFIYRKERRLKSDYIFCSVEFEEGYKSYYYLTEDDSIEVDDLVVVPVGKDERKAIVQVVDIEYFNESNVPYPLEKMKRIIRKCTDEELADEEDCE